jgi:hypothetical protein
MMMGTLSGVEMGLDLAKVPHRERRRAGGDGSAQGTRTPSRCRRRRAPEIVLTETTTERAAMNAPVAATEDLIYSVEDGIAG